MPDSCEVAIIGAGTSGLTAAYQLRDLNPVVLESDGEIGGRSRRVELAGRPTTSGAEGWYDPNSDSPESRFLAEVGIECKGVKGPVLLHANGQIVRMSSPERLAEGLGLSDQARPDFVRTFERVGEACTELNHNPVPDGLIPELLRMSAIEWLGPVHEEVTAFYRRLCACEQGTYFGTASAFQFVYGMPPFGGASDIWMEILVPHGGAPMISVALAKA
jgi:monoamine oxidase